MSGHLYSQSVFILLYSVSILVGLIFIAYAEEESFSGRDDAHYSADNPIDFLHMRLQVSFSQEQILSRQCSGQVDFQIKPRRSGICTITLNAVDMKIQTVECPDGPAPIEHSYDDRVLSILFPEPLDMDSTYRIRVSYRIDDPQKGLYFVLPTPADPGKLVRVYSMGEPLESRYWMPCHDWPNEHWTSEFYITVPRSYQVVASGSLVNVTPSSENQSSTYHWSLDTPTDPHFIGFVIGEFIEIKDSWRDKPVTVYTQPELEKAARYTFRHVPEMLEYYSTLLDYEYPYPAYSHVTINGHHHGGMEQAGFSILDPYFMTESEDGETSTDWTESELVAHMLAHQWFAGIVNYRSLSQAWLNEGFASYLHLQWRAHKYSTDLFDCHMQNWAERIAASHSSESGKPMVLRDFNDPEEVYGSDGQIVYWKGAWVLHMLRERLGDKLFWRAINRYLHRHQGSSVETTDLRQVLEEESGYDLEQFFEQWIYGHGIPHLRVNYRWDLAQKQAVINIQQTQKITPETPAFSLPLELYFQVVGRKEIRQVYLSETERTYTFPFLSEPTIFVVDPRNVVLKTVELEIPQAMKIAAALEGPTAVSRRAAAGQLGKPASPEPVQTLKRIVDDPSEFWMVRSKAAETLGIINTDAALDSLLNLDEVQVQNSRVWAAVISALGRYPTSKKAHEKIVAYAKPQESLAVETAAVAALGKMNGDSALAKKSDAVLLKALHKPSRRTVRSAALITLRNNPKPEYFQPILKIAHTTSFDELRKLFIESIGYIGRQEKWKDRALHELQNWLLDPDPNIRISAVRGLGALQYPRTGPILENIIATSRNERLVEAAREAKKQ